MSARAMSRPMFYTNPICPFAHRALMSIAEKGLTKEVDVTLIPLSLELKMFSASGSTASSAVWKDQGKSPEELVKIKEDYKLKINPSGEVPSLEIDGRVVSEADVLAEFLDDYYPDSKKLWPSDPFQRAQTRKYLKNLGGNTGVTSLYVYLMNQDPATDEAKRDNVYKGLEMFCSLADAEGPFFLGKELSFADVMLAPFYDRFRATLKHYRDLDFIPLDAAAYPWAPRLRAWAAAIDATPSFVSTIMPAEDYVRVYKDYAGARGPSKIGV